MWNSYHVLPFPCRSPTPPSFRSWELFFFQEQHFRGIQAVVESVDEEVMLHRQKSFQSPEIAFQSVESTLCVFDSISKTHTERKRELSFSSYSQVMNILIWTRSWREASPKGFLFLCKTLYIWAEERGNSITMVMEHYPVSIDGCRTVGDCSIFISCFSVR